LSAGRNGECVQRAGWSIDRQLLAPNALQGSGSSAPPVVQKWHWV